MKFDFIPFESVGIFKLDSDIDQYWSILKDYDYVPKDEFGSEYYYPPNPPYPDNDFSIKVENNKLRSVFCNKELYFNNINLIGLRLPKFEEVTQSNYTGEIDKMDYGNGTCQFIYEFDEIGALVWEENGIIVAIIVSGKWSYSDEPWYPD